MMETGPNNEQTTSVARAALKPGVVEKLRSFLFGHDIFISYSRADALVPPREQNEK
jgi:hypothetical protein